LLRANINGPESLFYIGQRKEELRHSAKVKHERQGGLRKYYTISKCICGKMKRVDKVNARDHSNMVPIWRKKT
jgi:hypothetical protein